MEATATAIAGASGSGSGASLAGELLEKLMDKGWRFRDLEQIGTLIQEYKTAEALEAELLNMDLRSFGGHSLPDPTAMKKLNHLQGPKIVQVKKDRFFFLFPFFLFQTPFVSNQ